MEKRKIKKQIVFKSFDSTPTWKDLKEIQEKTPFQDDDMVAMLWIEEDCEFIISVERYVEETDQ